MKISFDLSDADLRYFRERLRAVRSGEQASDEKLVIAGARRLVEQVLASESPEFVRGRIEKLGQLVRMLEDAEWRLEGADRVRVVGVLAYFVDPDDLIPDRIPGLGYLDDAIMVELVVQELRHEIEAYEAFCAIRRERGPDPEVLEASRLRLQARMRRRRRHDLDRRRSRRRGGSGRSPISLW
jgi:uncharacterized membrane protein YkvA (DUF1232 family)